jgi:hypothetical protein
MKSIEIEKGYLEKSYSLTGYCSAVFLIPLIYGASGHPGLKGVRERDANHLCLPSKVSVVMGYIKRIE